MNDLERLRRMVHGSRAPRKPTPERFDEDGNPMFHRTQQQVAEKLGVSAAMVRRVEESALRKLKVAIRREAAERGVTVRQWMAGE